MSTRSYDVFQFLPIKDSNKFKSTFHFNFVGPFQVSQVCRWFLSIEKIVFEGSYSHFFDLNLLTRFIAIQSQDLAKKRHFFAQKCLEADFDQYLLVCMTFYGYETGSQC